MANNKLPREVMNLVEELPHEIEHIENLNAMIDGIVDEIEEQRFQKDRDGMVVAYELNRNSLMTLLHLQRRLIQEVTERAEEMRAHAEETSGEHKKAEPQPH